ncbi:hypothetical protein M527_09850 [Sphingobium indicum IP26]|uniref:hypothetical protein n=1 Tax=Sphingobium indicum TaxID=332055 RepID=UPI00036C64F9|nr:hypothetical protein M527_09850 [Sphingobium indicum IP26]
MSTRAARFKQADATRALRAAVAAGLKPSGYRIDPAGAIVVMFADGAPRKAANSNPWDEELQP